MHRSSSHYQEISKESRCVCRKLQKNIKCFSGAVFLSCLNFWNCLFANMQHKLHKTATQHTPSVSSNHTKVQPHPMLVDGPSQERGGCLDAVGFFLCSARRRLCQLGTEPYSHGKRASHRESNPSVWSIFDWRLQRHIRNHTQFQEHDQWFMHQLANHQRLTAKRNQSQLSRWCERFRNLFTDVVLPLAPKLILPYFHALVVSRQDMRRVIQELPKTSLNACNEIIRNEMCLKFPVKWFSVGILKHGKAHSKIYSFRYSYKNMMWGFSWNRTSQRFVLFLTCRPLLWFHRHSVALNLCFLRRGNCSSRRRDERSFGTSSMTEWWNNEKQSGMKSRISRRPNSAQGKKYLRNLQSATTNQEIWRPWGPEPTSEKFIWLLRKSDSSVWFAEELRFLIFNVKHTPSRKLNLTVQEKLAAAIFCMGYSPHQRREWKIITSCVAWEKSTKRPSAGL